MHFDAAVNHGVSRAKKFLEQSEGDFDKYYEIRKNFYASFAKNDSSQMSFKKGWNNRLNKIKNINFD